MRVQVWPDSLSYLCRLVSNAAGPIALADVALQYWLQGPEPPGPVPDPEDPDLTSQFHLVCSDATEAVGAMPAAHQA
jgi:hypothetical protein